MRRAEAIALVKEHVKSDAIFKHMLATEAIMRELALHFGEDEGLWGMAGLLHDLDFEMTKAQFERHGMVAADILKDRVPDAVIRAIASHNCDNTGVKPESRMEKALIVSDSLSGLLVACALVMPSRRLQEVKVEGVEKKFRSKDFARSVSRERILICEEFGLSKEVFFEMALRALQRIGDQLGL